MIHRLSKEPSLDIPDQLLYSESLTDQVRTIFAAAEGKISFSDANRISGVIDYDNSGCLGWIHEWVNSNLFR